jgi:pimeloyl-ACP methyl ester carboxylesterase
MRRGTFTIGNLQLSTASTGTGRTCLFLHGLCGEAAQPAGVFPHDCGWQCVTLECRGHGQSDCGDIADLSIRRFADDVAAFTASLDGPPPVIGGISMGAAIALRLAVTSPDSFCGLVLARPAWVDQPAPETLASHRQIAACLAEHAPVEALRRFRDSASAKAVAAESPDNLASLLGFFTRQPIDQTRALLATIGNDGPGVRRQDIAALAMPALIIGTDRDAVHPLAMAHELATLIPTSQFVQITSKSEDPDSYVVEFREALRRFLKEI